MTQRAWIPLYVERLATSPKYRRLGNDMGARGAYLSLFLVADRDSASEHCGMIFDRVDEGGRLVPISTKRLSEIAGIPRRSLPGYLARLVDSGLVIDHGADEMHVVELANFRKTLRRLKWAESTPEATVPGGGESATHGESAMGGGGGKGGGKGGEFATPSLIVPRAQNENENTPTGGAQALPARPKASKRRAPTEPPTDAAQAGGSLFPEAGPPTKRPNNNPTLAAFAEAWEDRYRSPHAWGRLIGKAAGDLGATVRELGLDLRTEDGLNEWRAVCRAYLDDDGAAESKHPWGWLPTRASGYLAQVRARPQQPQVDDDEIRRLLAERESGAAKKGA